MTATALVMGARGRFGQAAVQAFAEAGWRVVAQHRPGSTWPQGARTPMGVEPVATDVNDHDALVHVARGAEVVVHAINPSSYTKAAWERDSLPLLERSIAVARALGATLMLPGNVYNFGSGMPEVLGEDTAQQADTVKGRVRMAMEQRLRHSGVRSVVIRAGDFFGSGRGTWFDQVVVKKLPQGTLTYPGQQRDCATAWAYLPDLARTFVEVAQRRDVLQPTEVLHFAGHRLSARQWMDALTPVAQAQAWLAPEQALRWGQLPWGLMRLGQWLVPTWASFLEMQYLWNTPHRLDNRRLVALLGTEPHTPLTEAIHAALVDLALLPDQAKKSLHQGAGWVQGPASGQALPYRGV